MAGLLALASIALSGCNCPGGENPTLKIPENGNLFFDCVGPPSQPPAKPFSVKDADVKTKLAKFKEENGTKTRFFSVQAKKKKADAVLEIPVPYALYGNFVAKVTAGVYTQKFGQNLGDGYVGIELRDPADPATFYGVYAKRRVSPAGLEIFVATRDGQQGPAVVIDDESRVELTLSANSGTLELSAAPGGRVALVQLVNSAGPYVAWLVVRGIADRSSVGFSNLSIPVNGPNPTKGPRAAAGTPESAIDNLTESGRAVLEAYSRLNTPSIFGNAAAVSLALASFDTARIRMEAAIRDVAGFAPDDDALRDDLLHLRAPLDFIYGLSAFDNTQTPREKAASMIQELDLEVNLKVAEKAYMALVAYL